MAHIHHTILLKQAKLANRAEIVDDKQRTLELRQIAGNGVRIHLQHGRMHLEQCSFFPRHFCRREPHIHNHVLLDLAQTAQLHTGHRLLAVFSLEEFRAESILFDDIRHAGENFLLQIFHLSLPLSLF